jgi:hypothetical protein
MQPYAYRPLASEPFSIRLLQILPGAKGSDIHCSLIDYTIPPDQLSGLYEALSYTWGDPGQRNRIYVRDTGTTEPYQDAYMYLDITKNLSAALHRLRDTALPRLMWIDAVCINQDDLQERAGQVQIMATIYSFASRVIVWLGLEADDSTNLFAEIEGVAADVQRNRETGIDHDREVASDRGDTSLMNKSLIALLNRPWFHRVWVRP